MEHHEKFHFQDNSSAGSLEELRDILENISYQEFYDHVNADKNDFANWVRGVFQNEELASDLEKVTSIVETVEIINDFTNPLPPGTHDDIQSQIEKQVDIHVSVEDVPTTEPVVEHSEETTEIHEEPEEPEVHEEPAKEHEEPPEEHESADLDAIREKIEETEDLPELPEPAEPHEPQPEGQTQDHILNERDYTRLIVKDFMYGLIFGLIIGLILGRILSF